MLDLFTADRIKLTGVRDGDREIMNRWNEDSEYARNLEYDIAYPGAVLSFPEPVFEFVIRLIETDTPIGFTAIHSLEWGSSVGRLSIGIGGEHRSSGYGNEALALILRYAFYELNLHRVSLEVIAYNERAVRLYERFGFREEGRAREQVYRDGKRYDLIMMGILRREWLEKNQTSDALTEPGKP